MLNVSGDKALVFGRFQPFHNGHLAYVQTVANEHNSFIVGITNSSPNMIEPNSADDHRHLSSSNPFTYYERLQMIKNSLVGIGCPASSFDIVPFPINKPDQILYYIPKDISIFVAICGLDPWGEQKVRILTELGLQVYKVHFERIASGAEIRRLMKNGGSWESLVSKEVADFIKEKGLVKKVQDT